MSVVWRDAVPEDLPRIVELWQEQMSRFQELAPTVQADLPELFPVEHPILRVRVCERGSVIVAAKTVEAVCEVQLIGGDEEVMRSLARELPEECQWARNQGYRSGWGLAPKVLAKPIERSLRHTPLRAWPNLMLIGCDFSELGD